MCEHVRVHTAHVHVMLCLQPSSVLLVYRIICTCCFEQPSTVLTCCQSFLTCPVYAHTLYIHNTCTICTLPVYTCRSDTFRTKVRSLGRAYLVPRLVSTAQSAVSFPDVLHVDVDCSSDSCYIGDAWHMSSSA